MVRATADGTAARPQRMSGGVPAAPGVYIFSAAHVLCSRQQDETAGRTRLAGTRGKRRRLVDFGHELRIFITAIVYAFAGMALLLIGYRLFDALTPSDLQKKIFEEGNIAVAVAVGFFMLGVAVVIHGAFST
jgi:putative membrane protein